MYIDLPTIKEGTVDEQLAQIRSYVHRANEQFVVLADNTSVERIWENTSKIISANIPDDSEEKTDRFKSLTTQMRKTRDLIIKTAETVLQSEETVQRVFNGAYVAKGNFGNYLLNTKLTINESSTAVEQLFDYAAKANQYGYTEQNFIKQGLLDNTGSTPIYGIEVGILNQHIEDGGQTIDFDTIKKVRITPTRMSFFNNADEVAYISGSAIYFPNAKITGGDISGAQITGTSIELDNGQSGGNRLINFSVSSTGDATFRSGYFKVLGENPNSYLYISAQGSLRIKKNNTDVFFISSSGDLSAGDGTFSGDVSVSGSFSSGGAHLGMTDIYREMDISYNNDVYGKIVADNDNDGFYIQMKNPAKFFAIKNNTRPIFFFTETDGYESGITAGFYSVDTSNNYHKTFTGTKTINGTNYQFVNGLLVE